jgi:NAD(P)-dependent dehydrogenase (short-subunit alcohol dehydrogenase family)
MQDNDERSLCTLSRRSCLLTRLSGKTAIVTGAANGMGRSIALALGSAGAKVIVADVDELGAADVARTIEGSGGAAVAIRVDVSSRSSVEDMVQVNQTAPDILICAAGVTSAQGNVPPKFLQLPDDEFAAVMAINLGGIFLCAQTLARRLVSEQRPGSFVLVTSLGVDRPNPGGAAYHASKGGVDALVRALAVELAAYRIRVNGVAPGYMSTRMTDFFRDEARSESVRARVPLRRVGEPSDLDGLCLFLAGEESSYITGQTIAVDGGASIIGAMSAPPLVGSG